MATGTIVVMPDATFAPGTSGQPFAAVIVFGDGVYAPPVGAKVAIPLPFGGAFDATYARLLSSGSATWAVYLTSGITGSATSVGGTAPAVSAALGVVDSSLDWTTVTFSAGDVLIVELTALSGAAGATLVLVGTKS